MYISGLGLTRYKPYLQVRNILRGGRFKAVINNDDQFVEEYRIYIHYYMYIYIYKGGPRC